MRGSCSTKEAQPEEDPSVAARLQRLQNNYEDFGMRRTVEGVLVVHDHGHPHILMLQIANAFFKLYVSLLVVAFMLPTSGPSDSSPGDYLKPGEEETSGLKARLDERLAPIQGTYPFGEQHGVDNDWEIGDCLAQWWRPNFETFMVRHTPFLTTRRRALRQYRSQWLRGAHSLGPSADCYVHRQGLLMIIFSRFFLCSTRLSRLISPSQRSAKNCSWSRCPNEVRPACLLVSSTFN